MSSTLGVTGAVTLESTLGVTGATTLTTFTASGRGQVKNLVVEAGALSLTGAYDWATTPYGMRISSIPRVDGALAPIGPRDLTRWSILNDNSIPLQSSNGRTSVLRAQSLQWQLGTTGIDASLSWDGARVGNLISITDMAPPVSYTRPPSSPSAQPSLTGFWVGTTNRYPRGGTAPVRALSQGSIYHYYSGIILNGLTSTLPGARNYNHSRHMEVGLTIRPGASTRIYTGVGAPIESLTGLIPPEGFRGFTVDRGSLVTPGYRTGYYLGGNGYAGPDPFTGVGVEWVPSVPEPHPTGRIGMDTNGVVMNTAAFRWTGGRIAGGAVDDDDVGALEVGPARLAGTANGADLSVTGHTGAASGTSFSGSTLVNGDVGMKAPLNAVMYDQYGGLYQGRWASGNAYAKIDTLVPPTYFGASPPANLSLRMRGESGGDLGYLVTEAASTTSHPTMLTHDTMNAVAGMQLEYLSGPAAGEVQTILTYDKTTRIVTTNAFSTVPTATIEAITNGTLNSAPVVATVDPIPNIWQWTKNGGTGTVTWDAGPPSIVTLTGDGTNAAAIDQLVTVTSGIDYIIRITHEGSLTLKVGTTRGDDDLGGDYLPYRTGQADEVTGTIISTYSFPSSGTSAWITLQNETTTPAQIDRVQMSASSDLPVGGIRARVIPQFVVIKQTWTERAILSLQAAGGHLIVGGTVGVAGNFAVATNKFTVAAASGNTVVAGTLGVTGASTLAALSATTGTFSSTATATAFVPSSAAVPTNGLYLPAANTLGFAINSAAEMSLTSSALSPAVSDGLSLGTSSLMWSDAFFASGAVLNFANGDVTLTHSSDALAMAGGTLSVIRDSTAASGTTSGMAVSGDQSVANTGNFYGVMGGPTYSAASGNTLVGLYGGSFYPTNTSTGTITNLQGVRSAPDNASTGTITTMTAINARSTNSGGGAVTTMYGLTSVLINSSTGIVTTAYGIVSSLFNSNAGGTVTTYYGAFLATASNSGTLVNNWGLYQQDTAAKNALLGRTLIGGLTDDASTTVQVNGTFKATGASTLAGLTATTIAGTTGTFSSTLGVTGASTLAALSATTGAFSGDVAVATNKFTVAAASGNTAVAGTLGVTSNFAVATNKFTVTAASGNTVVAGTLNVTGLTTIKALNIDLDDYTLTGAYSAAAAPWHFVIDSVSPPDPLSNAPTSSPRALNSWQILRDTGIVYTDATRSAYGNLVGFEIGTNLGIVNGAVADSWAGSRVLTRQQQVVRNHPREYANPSAYSSVATAIICDWASQSFLYSFGGTAPFLGSTKGRGKVRYTGANFTGDRTGSGTGTTGGSNFTGHGLHESEYFFSGRSSVRRATGHSMSIGRMDGAVPPEGFSAYNGSRTGAETPGWSTFLQQGVDSRMGVDPYMGDFVRAGANHAERLPRMRRGLDISDVTFGKEAIRWPGGHISGGERGADGQGTLRVGTLFTKPTSTGVTLDASGYVGRAVDYAFTGANLSAALNVPNGYNTPLFEDDYGGLYRGVVSSDRRSLTYLITLIPPVADGSSGAPSTSVTVRMRNEFGAALRFAVSSTATTTSIPTNLSVTTDNYFSDNGPWLLEFLTGVCAGEVRAVTGYTASTGTLTTAAFSTSPTATVNLVTNSAFSSPISLSENTLVGGIGWQWTNGVSGTGTVTVANGVCTLIGDGTYAASLDQEITVAATLVYYVVITHIGELTVKIGTTRGGYELMVAPFVVTYSDEDGEYQTSEISFTATSSTAHLRFETTSTSPVYLDLIRCGGSTEALSTGVQAILRVPSATITQAWTPRSTLSIQPTGGAATFGGTLGVTGASSLAGLTATTIAGTTGAFSGDFAVATNKFTVAATTGNTVVGGTLGVTGASALAALSATTGTFSSAATATAFIPSSSATVPTNGMYLPATNTLGWGINSAAEVQLTSTALSPAVSDGSALGTSSLMWGDLFLASGGVINFNASNVTITHSAAALGIAGATVTVTRNSTDASGGTIAALSIAGAQSVANAAGALQGLDASPSFTAASGSLGTLLGVRGLPMNSGAGTVTDLRGIVAHPMNTSTGTVTNSVGVWVRNDNQNVGGTVTTAYGVYIAAPSNAGTMTTKWGLYQVDIASKNFLGGRTLIGSATDDASTNLQVNGTFKVTGASTLAALSATTGTFSSTATATAFTPSSSATVPTNGMYLPAANTLGWAINSAAEMQLTASALSPAVSDGLALGSTTLMWSDLFLASGAVLDFANSDVTITHASNLLTMAGGGFTFSGARTQGDFLVETLGTLAGAPGIRARGYRSDASGSIEFGGQFYAEGVRTDAMPSSGKVFGGLVFGGNTDLTPTMGYTASITGVSDAAWVDTANAATAIVFRTGTAAQARGPNIAYGTDRGRITSGGRWLLGSSTDDASTTVQVNGTFKATGASTLASLSATTGAFTGVLTLAPAGVTTPGTIAYTYQHIIGADSAAPAILIDAFDSNGQINARRANGTSAAPTAVTANQIVFRLAGRGYEGTTPGYTGQRAFVEFMAAENYTSTAQGMHVNFGTTATGASSNAVTAMRLHANGALLIGGTTDDGTNKLRVSGGITVDTGNSYKVNNVAVVGVRKTGWVAATGTATRTTFVTSTVTTEQLAERLKALIDDLISHGLVGA